METMGQRIKMLRDAKGLSLDQVARLIGVSKAAVGHWETGLTENIRPENLLRLCEEFGTDPWYIVFGAGRKPSGPPPAQVRQHKTA